MSSSSPVDTTETKGSESMKKTVANKASSSTALSVKEPGKSSSISKASTKVSGKVSSLLSRSSKSVRTGADVVKSLKWVIFPDNKYIKKWDLIVLGALFLFVFILPYQIGISGGVSIIVNIPWFVFNVFLNSIFFVDTFLYFFRAYYTKDGHLVLDLKTIRRNYLRTYFIPNFISVLPFTIAFYVVGNAYLDSDGDPDSNVESFLTFIMIASLLKLIRLTRANTILSSSDAIINFRQKRNSQVLQLWTYVWLIVVVSHWFACIWSFVAFIEADSFDEENLLATPNWIGYWANNNAVDGGLYPLGWKPAIDRYVLSLFWAIQTITSIGYGNIVPVTLAEYFVACCLQLAAGIMWAYVIGGLVGVASGMQVRAETYRTRIDQANDLIHQFEDPDEINEDDDNTIAVNESKRVAKRIRTYIHKQYTRSKTDACVNTLNSFFPVFDTLTPELQQNASVLLVNRYLKAVSYLSSKYMSQHVQSFVATQSSMLEFSSGEIIDTENAVEGLGRGVFVFRSGCAFDLDQSKGSEMSQKLENIGLLTAGMAYGDGKVLLEDGSPAAHGELQFLTYSQLLFIPRKAILDALKKSEKAWKQCARWVYLRTLILAKMDEDEQASSE